MPCDERWMGISVVNTGIAAGMEACSFDAMENSGRVVRAVNETMDNVRVVQIDGIIGRQSGDGKRESPLRRFTSSVWRLAESRTLRDGQDGRYREKNRSEMSLNSSSVSAVNAGRTGHAPDGELPEAEGREHDEQVE